MRRGFRVVTMVAAITTLTAGAPAVANNIPTPDPCFTYANNGDTWSVGVPGGFARFHEYGDRLEVVDTASDGVRTTAIFQYCEDGGFKPNGRFDSGPNEGSVDREWHDFDYAEKRKVRFKVCNDSGCSSWQNANA